MADINDATQNVAIYDENGNLVEVTTDNRLKVDTGLTVSDGLEVSYADGSNMDAFGRLRVSNPHTLFDSKQLHDKLPLVWAEKIGGTATSTFDDTNSQTNMTVSGSGDSVIRQTYMRFNYQPGKSMLMYFTYRATDDTGVVKRIGYFDGTVADPEIPKDGIFFENDGGTLSFNIAKNGTTSSITQTNWNLDKFDGTGTSGITYDSDKAQIMVIDFEWLSVGRVRVGFIVAGKTYYVHEFKHANLATSAFMKTPNLPVRYYIGCPTTGTGTLNHICSTIISEGGLDTEGIPRSFNTGSNYLDAAVNGTKYMAAGLRLKDDHLSTDVRFSNISVLASVNEEYLWELLWNPTYSGTPTWTSAGAESSVDRVFAQAQETITDDGVVLASGYGSGRIQVTNESILSDLRIGADVDSVPDELIIAITPLGNNQKIYGSMAWRELL